MEKIALIPAYCPDHSMIELLKKLNEAGFACCVVDDGSPIEFQSIFAEAEDFAAVLHQSPNQGKGAALRYGLRFIKEHTSDSCIIVTLDADGQHTPEDASKCARASLENPGCLILGCRDFSGRDVPAHNRMGNHLTAGLFALCTGVSVSDTQTGLRAFDRSMIDFLLKIEGNRYEYEMNMLLGCARSHVAIRQIPIATIYQDGNKSTHFHVLRDSFLIYRQLFQFAASSMASFAVDYSLFAILSMFFTPVASNLIARLFSAAFNYQVNRKAVFHEEGSASSSLLKYIVLAACILAVNTLLLNLLVSSLGMNEYLAKLLVELILFLASWSIQKNFVFVSGRRIA